VKNVRRHGAGWELYTRVGGRLVTEQRETAPTVKDVRDWKADKRREFRAENPQSVRGTFAADVDTYLSTVRSMPSYQSRAIDIRAWIPFFGNRSRRDIKAYEIKAVLERWLTPPERCVECGRAIAVPDDPHEAQTKCACGGFGGPGYGANTVKHRRTALMHLWHTLDGKEEKNPIRNVPPPRPPDDDPRGLPYDIVTAILDALPERRYAQKLTGDDVTRIQAALKRRGANMSSIAEEFGVSETMIRKIRDGRHVDRSESWAKTRTRCRAIAWTGIPPAQLMRINPKRDIDWKANTVIVQGRRKGGGTKTRLVKLIPEAVEAFRDMERADAWGSFSTSSVRKSFLIAAAKVEGTLAGIRPYDLRHSFLTGVYAATGDIHITAAAGDHADIRQSRRYTLAAVDPKMADAVERFRARAQGQIAEAARLAENVGGRRK
jgi:integrase